MTAPIVDIVDRAKTVNARLQSAVRELNAALDEAVKCNILAEMDTVERGTMQCPDRIHFTVKCSIGMEQLT